MVSIFSCGKCICFKGWIIKGTKIKDCMSEMDILISPKCDEPGWYLFIDDPAKALKLEP